MSREEEEPPEEFIRPARHEEKHFLSSIVRAKFVDEYRRKVPIGEARVIASYSPAAESAPVVESGERKSPIGHWVRGHWHRHAVGPGRLERRLQWV
jgi:hypothetical protein